MDITLAGQTLPCPNRYRVATQYRGGGVMMADGTPRFDLVNDTGKYRFELSWVALAPADRTALEAAWDVLKDTSAGFTDWDGSVYTVSRDPATPDLALDALVTSSAVHWSSTITLLEE